MAVYTGGAQPLCPSVLQCRHHSGASASIGSMSWSVLILLTAFWSGVASSSSSPSDVEGPNCQSLTPGLKESVVFLGSSGAPRNSNSSCSGLLFSCTHSRPVCPSSGSLSCARSCGPAGCTSLAAVCDGSSQCPVQRSLSAPDSVDEAHCSWMLASFHKIIAADMDHSWFTTFRVDLGTCASLCFRLGSSCDFFSYSYFRDRRCRIGCDGCSSATRLETQLSTDLFNVTGITRRLRRQHLLWTNFSIADVSEQMPDVLQNVTEPGTGGVKEELVDEEATEEDQKEDEQITDAEDGMMSTLSQLPSSPHCGMRDVAGPDTVHYELSQYDPASAPRRETVDKIVGGFFNGTIEGELPWMCSLELPVSGRKYRHLCGCSVLTSHHLVTAAHCVIETANKYQVRVGQHQLDRIDKYEQVFLIREIIKYPTSFNGVLHDIAIIRIKSPHDAGIQFSKYVRPICLSPSSVLPPWSPITCLISGWGFQQPNASSLPSQLQAAEVVLISNQFCSSPESYGSLFNPETQVCAGGLEDRVDSCQGDSGGPLACFGRDNSWYLVGVVSRGSGCGQPTMPGIYSRISFYRKWISDTIEYMESV